MSLMPMFLSAARPATTAKSLGSFVDRPIEAAPRGLQDIIHRLLTTLATEQAKEEVLEEISEERSEEKEQRMRLKANWLETADKHTIAIEIPGVDKSKIKLQAVGTGLRVSGEVADLTLPKEDKSASFRIKEHRHGSFTRTFRIGSNAKLDDVSASFSNGILTVTVPKLQVKVVDITIN